MKKRGVTYTEILVAITIFSLGVVPLMLSLNSAFEATVFNRDYTKAMEYNAQLMEEISAMMPTKVGKSDYADLEALKTDVEEVIEARSESNASKRGIYPVLEGSGGSGSFKFKFDSISSGKVDYNFYRVVEVEEEVVDEKKLILLHTKIDNLYTKNNELVARSNFTIRLEDSSDGGGETGNGTIGGIDIPNGVDSVETGEVTSPNEESNFIRVVLHADTGNVTSKFADVEVSIDGGSYQTMSHVKTQGKYLTFEIGDVEIPGGTSLKFRLSRNEGTNGKLKLTLNYYLYKF